MSTPSTIPWFGRKWELQILTAPENGSQVVWTLGQDSWLPESLRVTFDINQAAYKDLWWADISIYNLNSPTQQAVIQNGYEVILKAGYQTDENLGIIFQGRVFQVLWTREEVVDYKLTLHCMVGLQSLIDNMVSFQAPAGVSQRDIVLTMAKSAQTPINITQLDSDTLGTKILPRGEVIFGSAHKYFGEVANSYGLQFWHDGTGMTLASIVPPASKVENPDMIYSAVPNPASNTQQQEGITYTIVGTPEQIPEGVRMRVLLDSRLMVKAPAITFKIDNTVVTQMEITPPSLPPILSRSGVYAIAGIMHHGDTRGNEWYSDVVGYTLLPGGVIPALLSMQSLKN